MSSVLLPPPLPVLPKYFSPSPPFSNLLCSQPFMSLLARNLLLQNGEQSLPERQQRYRVLGIVDDRHTVSSCCKLDALYLVFIGTLPLSSFTLFQGLARLSAHPFTYPGIHVRNIRQTHPRKVPSRNPPSREREHNMHTDGHSYAPPSALPFLLTPLFPQISCSKACPRKSLSS